MSLFGQGFGLGMTGTQPHKGSNYADLYWLGIGGVLIVFSIFSLGWAIIFDIESLNNLDFDVGFGIILSPAQENGFFDFLTDLSLILFIASLVLIILSLRKRLMLRRAMP